MASNLVMLVIVLFCLAGVTGADKNIGEDCVPGTDTCVDSTPLQVTCDAITLKCSIQAGQNCNGADHRDKCVSNAACDTDNTNTCLCETDYTAVNGICGKTIGEVCDADNDICVDGTLKVTCDGGKCLIQAGQKCDGDDDGEKCVSNAKCADTTCNCNSDYTNDNGVCKREDDNGGGIVAVSFAVVALVSVVSLLFTLH